MYNNNLLNFSNLEQRHTFLSPHIDDLIEKIMNIFQSMKVVSSCENFEIREDDILNSINNSLNNILKMIDNLIYLINQELSNNRKAIEGITHEFKTPISNISVCLQLMEYDFSPYNEKESAIKNLNDVLAGSYEFINNVLEVYGKSDVVEFFDLKELIYHSLDNYYDQLNDKKLIVEIDNFSFLVSRHNIIMLLNNIISNAVKYARTYIEIKSDSKKIYFKNDIKEKEKKDRESYGMRIVNLIAVKIDVKIDFFIENDQFCFVLDFTE